ncbi:MAG: PHP domain-containing protein [Candidatus Paceibacteria bacterium]
MPNFDLHMHSTYSDGDLDLDKLLKRCKEKGLKTVSVTDHDTIDHIKPAKKIGSDLGLRVVSGVEISVGFQDRSYHLLGYGFNFRDKAIQKEMEKQVKSRKERIKKIAINLKKLGFDLNINIKKIANKDGSIGRPFLAKKVIENPSNKKKLEKENIKCVQDVFDNYLKKGKPAYEERYRTNLDRAIKIIHQSGGISSWAHPVFDTRDKPEILETTLEQFVDCGLDAIEVFYGNQNLRDTRRIFKLSERYDLVKTAGSDFHGPSRKKYSKIGDWNLHDFSSPECLDFFDKKDLFS